MGLCRLGKRFHKVLRDIGNTGKTRQGTRYVKGEPVKEPKEEVQIFANIQPFISNQFTRLLSAGDRDKEAIWFSSDHKVFTAQSDESTDADIIVWNNFHWKVMSVQPYGNFGTHVEGVAIKINSNENDGLTNQRVTGVASVI